MANLLYDSKGQLKVCDFGLARRACLTSFGTSKIESEMTANVVSLWYRPPELLLGGTCYGEAIDNWGVGCIFGELLKGRPILRGKTEIDQWDVIRRFKGGVKRGGECIARLNEPP